MLHKSLLRKFPGVGVFMAMMAVILLAGCAVNPSSSPEKIQAALNANSGGDTPPYILGATDVVTVSVWRNPDLSTSVPVRPDGKISVPLIGDVQASGRAPQELAKSIEVDLSGFIREPQVSVVVTSMGSHEFTDRVRVTGAIVNPISLPHRAGMTALDLLLSAGGANEFASLNNAMLYRSFRGEVVAIPVRLDDILSRGNIETNYRMQPGDILAIPERNF